MKYSGFQNCVDLEYFTPILITGSDTDLSKDDTHVDVMSPCSHASERKMSPGWRWHSLISKHHVGCERGKKYVTAVIDLYSVSIWRTP